MSYSAEIQGDHGGHFVQLRVDERDEKFYPGSPICLYAGNGCEDGAAHLTTEQARQLRADLFTAIEEAGGTP